MGEGVTRNIHLSASLAMFSILLSGQTFRFHDGWNWSKPHDVTETGAGAGKQKYIGCSLILVYDTDGNTAGVNNVVISAFQYCDINSGSLAWK